MRNVVLFLGFAASLVVVTSAANAGIVGVTVYDTNPSSGFLYQYSSVPMFSVTGDLGSVTPADINGQILVESTSSGDPSIDIENIIYNHSGVSWTSYLATILLNQPFTIAVDATVPTPFVNRPGDWGFSIVQPGLSPDQFGDYTGTIQFNGGTPVISEAGHDTTHIPGNQLDFGYTISFSGTQSPTFTQTLAPVPEPSTLALLGAGVAGLVAYGWRRSRAVTN